MVSRPHELLDRALSAIETLTPVDCTVDQVSALLNAQGWSLLAEPVRPVVAGFATDHEGQPTMALVLTPICEGVVLAAFEMPGSGCFGALVERIGDENEFALRLTRTSVDNLFYLEARGGGAGELIMQVSTVVTVLYRFDRHAWRAIVSLADKYIP